MLNKYIITEALNVVKNRHKNANNTAYSFLQKALENNEFKNIYYEIKNAEIQNAKAEVYGYKKPFNLKELENKKNIILNNLKINKNNLLPNYFCKKCNDTGYINNKMCCCLKQEINKALIKQSGINHKLQTFDNCGTKIFDNPQKMQEIYNILKKWCSTENKYLNVVLSGKTGVGKTNLLECMASELINNECIVYFTSAFNLNQNLLKFHTTFDNTRLNYIATLLDCDVLFIDDLGTEPILKNVTVEGLYNIIAERMENNKKTVISTNLNLNQIEDTYGERIFSRLLNQEKSLCINMENSDLRLKKTTR